MDCSSKRGRGKGSKETKKKKEKGAVATAEEEVGERKEGGDQGFLVAAKEAAAEVEVLRWSGADEEMTWASCWFPPFWEVEANGNAYDAFYGDVLTEWEFDLWGLKGGDDDNNI